VVVAMSGGVDSSVVAGLLAKQDYDLSAVFMRNWDTRDESGTDQGCEWKKDWADVQKVCKVLDIPCRLVDLSREYWTRVFEPSLHTWETGGTPNPDIWCNKEVKFGALVQRLTSPDTWLATGHYARKGWSSPPSLLSHLVSSAQTPIRPKLLRPLDRHKDQTFYLSSISEESLARSIFPIAHLNKPEVRKLAHEWGLPTAERDESMGICFVGQKRRFDDFLAKYIPPNPGPIVELATGRVIGTHNGLWSFTIGQNARVKGMPEKMFVCEKDIEKNTLYVVPGSNHPTLYKSGLVVRDWRWIWSDSPPPEIDTPSGFRARLQYRHRMMDVACTVHSRCRSRGDNDAELRIDFDDPQHAVAPGQVAVIWSDDWCLGCGIIDKAT
ncbi:tRNA-specific 2-thiouridylase, partial [Abortiporus biennis]